MIKKWNALLLVAVMLTAMLALCVQNAAAEGTNASDLPYVDLTFYMMDTSLDDMDAFYEALDALTLRDFNCRVRFKFPGDWIDYEAKYNLMLTTDPTIDLCYAAQWLSFPAYAKKDAYMDLTDLLPEYAPNIWARYPREQFNGASVGGKIYGIPQNAANHHLYMFTYREDLRKKYDLPDLSDLDLDNIELYMKTVLENEPDFRFAVPYYYSSPFGMFIPYTKKYDTIDSQGGIGASVAVLVERGTKNTVLYYELPEFVEFSKRMKRWSDMGFWSKGVLANPDPTEPRDLFNEGLVFASLSSHIDRATDVGETVMKNHPDWEINVIPYALWTGAWYNTRTTQDLTVIPSSSKNPERALMVIDKMLTDREYYDLTQYGVLGLNYEFDEHGAVSVANIDQSAHRFTVNLWALRNDDLKYPQFRFWTGRTEFEEKYFPLQTFDPFDGFEVDLTNVQAEYAAIFQVRQEYGEPLDWGLVDDVEASIEEYKQKMKEAGMDRFKEEIDRQVAEFFDAKN